MHILLCIHNYLNVKKSLKIPKGQSKAISGRTYSVQYTRILTDSARKRFGKGVLANYNKTKINIGHQHDRWMELNEALRVQAHAEVPLRMLFGN